MWAVMQNLVNTLNEITPSHPLFKSKLKELKQVQKTETDSLTEALYSDEISLPKYLSKIEVIYSYLKDINYGTTDNS